MTKSVNGVAVDPIGIDQHISADLLFLQIFPKGFIGDHAATS